MFRNDYLGNHFVWIYIVALLACALPSFSQNQTANDKLQQKVVDLQKDIDALSKAKAGLRGHASAAFLAGLEAELKAKLSALLSAEKKVESEKDLEQDISTLSALQKSLKARSDKAFLSSLNEEIDLKRKILDELKTGTTAAVLKESLNASPGRSPEAYVDSDALDKLLAIAAGFATNQTSKGPLGQKKEAELRKEAIDRILAITGGTASNGLPNLNKEANLQKEALNSLLAIATGPASNPTPTGPSSANKETELRKEAISSLLSIATGAASGQTATGQQGQNSGANIRKEAINRLLAVATGSTSNVSPTASPNLNKETNPQTQALDKLLSIATGTAPIQTTNGPQGQNSAASVKKEALARLIAVATGSTSNASPTASPNLNKETNPQTQALDKLMSIAAGTAPIQTTNGPQGQNGGANVKTELDRLVAIATGTAPSETASGPQGQNIAASVKKEALARPTTAAISAAPSQTANAPQAPTQQPEAVQGNGTPNAAPMEEKIAPSPPASNMQASPCNCSPAEPGPAEPGRNAPAGTTNKAPNQSSQGTGNTSVAPPPQPQNPANPLTSLTRSLMGAQQKRFQPQAQPLQEPASGRLLRILGGTDYTTSSSTESTPGFLLDTFLAFAPGAGREGNERQRFWVWGDTRLMGVPSPNATFSNSQITQQSFIQPSLKGVASLTPAVQFVAGFQVKLPWPTTTSLPSTTVNFILAGGASTPFSSPQNISIYDNNQSIQQRYPQVSTDLCKYPFVAFESQERDRFYRQYYGGLRFMNFRRPAPGSAREPFPGILDVTFGQDEAATGGALHGGLLRLDGSLPMFHFNKPWLYVFGTAEMELMHHKSYPPLVLNSSAWVGIQPTAADGVFPLVLPPPDRDLFRIGIGVNLNELIPGKKTRTY